MVMALKWGGVTSPSSRTREQLAWALLQQMQTTYCRDLLCSHSLKHLQERIVHEALGTAFCSALSPLPIKSQCMSYNILSLLASYTRPQMNRFLHGRIADSTDPLNKAGALSAVTC